MGGKDQEQETGGFYFMTCFSVEAKGHVLTMGKDLDREEAGRLVKSYFPSGRKVRNSGTYL